jgi:hypothetical protein
MADGGTTGPKRPARPGPNYVWNGKRWVKKATASKPTPPRGNRPPPMTYPAPSPKPTGPNPLYSPYLQMAPDFRWGGRTWGANDKDSFEGYLRSKGINPAVWYRNHPAAGRSFDPTQQAIYGAVNPQLMALDAERKKQEDYYGKMMSSLGNMSAALMPYLQQVPQVIAGAYEQGAGADTLLGEGYGGQFDQNQNANVNEQNAVLQQLGLSPALAASNDKGVVSSLGGGLEAEILKKAGPAYANAAAQWPKQASLEAQEAMNALLGQAASAGNGIDESIKEVLSGIPGMQQQIAQQQQQNDLAMRQQKLREISAAEEAAYKNWYIAKTNRNDKEAAYWKRQQNQLEKQRIALSQGNLAARQRGQTAQENKAMGLNANGTKPLPGYKWKNPKNHAAGTVKTGSGADGGGLREGETPAYIRTKAAHDLQSWAKSHTKKDLVSGANVPNFTYEQAFQYLYHTYVGYVKTSFKSEAAYRKMIMGILASNGIKPGGK